MQKTAQIKVIRTRQRTRAMQQHLRCQHGLRAGRFERLEGGRLFVRRVQQLRHQRQQRLGHFKAHQLRSVLRLQFGLALFALNRGERGFERVGRRGLVAALAFFVEVNRRAVQANNQRGIFHRHRRAAIVFRCHAVGTELLPGCHFPQKIEIQSGRPGFGQRQKFGQRGPLKFEQHIGRLDLGAFAVRRLNLIRGLGFGHHVADFEAAIFFIKNVQESVTFGPLRRG